MLHEAIFLATCNATMTTEKHCKLQRGCHTFAIFVRNLQRTRWKLLSSNLAQAKDALWLAHFNKIALQVTIDMSHAATCLATLRKEKDSSTFPVTCNATFCCIAGCENGVLHVQFFSQLATNVALQVAGKIASCNMAFRGPFKLVSARALSTDRALQTRSR